jgi:hypothetical protein
MIRTDEDDEFDRIERENRMKGQPYHYAPQRAWVGLTDTDRLELAAAQHSWEDLLIAAEAKLKEKNS